MAVNKETVDDINGSTPAFRQHFSINGRHFVIDLTVENKHNLERVLRPFMNAGREVKNGHRMNSHPRAKEIRAWAIAEGLMTSGRGKIPYRVYDAWVESHGE